MMPLRDSFKQVKLWMAVNAFVGLMKTFKYMRLFKKMSQLTDILLRAGMDMIGFGVIVMFVTFAFATFGSVLFGDHLRDFHNIASAMFSLTYWLVGDFSNVDYQAMKRAPWAPHPSPLYLESLYEKAEPNGD
jgi:hypothetical protein